MRNIHTKLIKKISLTLLLVPVFNIHNIYATEVDLELDISPALEISIPQSIVSLNLTPNVDGTPVFSTSDLDVSIATNNPTGYNLSLTANNTYLTNNIANRDGVFSEKYSGYWTSQASNPYDRWMLYNHGNEELCSGYYGDGNRAFGYAVRCILK